MESEKNQSKHSVRENKVLKFWEQDQTFKKTLEKDSPKGEFIFYDGPPFATGTPHYGHILAGTMKDVIPRYKTMQGFHVPRRWGWDCHGLPLENIIEKELGIKTKKEIEEMGVEKFNEAARSAVMRFAHIWEEQVPRFGRWVDMENDYRTMDPSYTKSVWWVFNELHKKGLVYEGYKSMQLCPRCGTTLSNFEVNQGYKDITDISVYVKFQLSDMPDTYLLAWTTTPWTIPGNSALAVNSKNKYVKVKHFPNSKYEEVILSESSFEKLKDKFTNPEVEPCDINNFIGKSYKTVFDFYIKESKVYDADFVTVEDGTGVVHIAPAFGQDDYELGKKNDLKFIQHVSPDGKFKEETKSFAGLDAKPIEDVQKTDVEIIKYLAGKGSLFAKEKIIHSYPHCWRCNTPLLNYASSSWFVKVTDIKDKLVEENKKVKWVPESIGQNRFGNWLEGARDWAISRSRYWGAPIPVWKGKEKDGKPASTKFISTVEEIIKFGQRKNRYLIMRHGEAESNIKSLVSSALDNKDPLTEKGRKQVDTSAEKLNFHLKNQNKKIDLVFVSPIFRTEQTLEIVQKFLNIDSDKIIVDHRLKEVDASKYDGKPWEEVFKLFSNRKEWYEKKVEGVESLSDVRKRLGEFLHEIDNKYKDKNILIISHNTPLKIVEALSKGLDYDIDIKQFDNAEFRELDFTILPRNRDFEIDFHRPYIDEVVLVDEKGELLYRVKDVFDCWFESGSMPYGESEYVGKDNEKFRPNSGLLKKSKGYPADFIAEGLDQTRGWFYSMLVLGVALFGKSPYKNVIVNGLALAEDGRKMSKSLKNYPDPMLIVDTYGADALRYYLTSSTLVCAEDLNFSEKGVDEVVKKNINRLDNVLSFYEMYKNEVENTGIKFISKDTLDLWIKNRLNQTINEITNGLEKYELHTASRPIADFIDDLSVWYLRRSREKMKDGNIESISTLKFVLAEFSKVIAPFMPFIAEDIYMRLGFKESVHMQAWPKMEKVEEKLVENMKKTRDLVTVSLELRTRFNIKVRQPLSTLKINSDLEKEFIELIKDEVNVKEVLVDKKLSKEAELDTNITEELKKEGIARDIIRSIQEKRKEKNLTVKDFIVLKVFGDEKIQEIVSQFSPEIKKVAQIKEIKFELCTPSTQPEPLSYRIEI